MILLSKLEAVVIMVAAIMFGCVLQQTARHVDVNVEWQP